MLAVARLPLSTVREGVDIDDRYEWTRNGDNVFIRQGYLQSLELEEKAGLRPTVLSVRLPKTVAVSGRRKSRHIRSVSDSFVVARKMAVVTAAAHEEATLPSSPPDLSYSKSSKSSSSSLRSDSSDEEELTQKLAHDEDLTDTPRDSIDDSNLRSESRPTLKRPPPRAATIGVPGLRASPTIGPHDNQYPSPRSPRNGVLRDQSLNIPDGRGLRRGFTSPSAPHLFTKSTLAKSSRSPSPTKPFMQNGVCVSPQTLASATPRLFADHLSKVKSADNLALGRRKSWQPGQRKSVKELEAECDDNDEEVPDDAVLENVPISPIPGQPRLSQSSSRAQSRETTPSPHRRPSHTNLHSANVPKRAKRPSAPTIMPNGQFGPPRSPRHGRPPMLPHSATVASFPPDRLHRKQRSKSWTEDLNEEAKKLTAALEEHADRISMEKHGSAPQSASNSPPRPSLPKERAKTMIMDFSPVQRGSVMIDPLPISKEKEAVLTRTRPSWLPPKDQKEEKKHMKEWEQMMARAMETQKKRALKEREEMESKEELEESIARIWDQHVLPNWDTVIQEPRTRELWWRGVTPKSRGLVWQRAIGNGLELSEASFDNALKRAASFEEGIAEMSDEDRSRSKEAAWFDAIARDVPNACPDLTESDKRAPYEAALRDVLRAYSMYRSDVGYVYGTHLVAGILCLHLRPSDAFVALANMLNRPLPLAFLVHDRDGMARAYELVLGTLRYKSTKLHDHLTAPVTGVKPEEYLDPIFRCLFAHNLPTEHVNRIWDIFVFEGDKALVRAAVAVLGKLEGKLYGTREEILDVVSWRNPSKWDMGTEDAFIAAVREAGKVESKGEPKEVIV